VICDVWEFTSCAATGSSKRNQLEAEEEAATGMALHAISVIGCLQVRRRPAKVAKVVDETTFVRCLTGTGIIREEVWQDQSGKVTKYNLAFINHFLCPQDNGRVLGYDNAHGTHERHFMGAVEPHLFTNYKSLVSKFLDEVGDLRKGKP
jgi:hypothetical protein